MKEIIFDFLKKILFLFLCISMKSNSQTVSSFAGGTQGFADGIGSAAKFKNPWGIAVDANGNLYVADAANNRIRKITSEGLVSTLAGGNMGYADGVGNEARFKYPTGVAVDVEGNVFVADMQNNAIRKIALDGLVTTIAGGTWGSADGVGTSAQFSSPYGIAIDNNGTLYVADKENSRIRKITSESVVTTFAGSTSGFADGTGTEAHFYNPFSVAVDALGNIIVGETHRIRKITPEGVVTTLAGSLSAEIGTTDGQASEALFNTPSGIAINSMGTIFLTDRGNHRIRKIDADGIVSTFAGSSYGFGNGIGTAAQFYYPNGIVLAPDGNFFVTDAANDRVRKINSPLNNYQYLLANQISIYPNPCSTQIHLQVGNLNASHFIIIDLNGRILLNKNIYDNTATIDVSTFVTGVYFIEIMTDKGNVYKKIVKQ